MAQPFKAKRPRRYAKKALKDALSAILHVRTAEQPSVLVRSKNHPNRSNNHPNRIIQQVDVMKTSVNAGRPDVKMDFRSNGLPHKPFDRDRLGERAPNRHNAYVHNHTNYYYGGNGVKGRHSGRGRGGHGGGHFNGRGGGGGRYNGRGDSGRNNGRGGRGGRGGPRRRNKQRAPRWWTSKEWRLRWTWKKESQEPSG